MPTTTIVLTGQGHILLTFVQDNIVNEPESDNEEDIEELDGMLDGEYIEELDCLEDEEEVDQVGNLEENSTADITNDLNDGVDETDRRLPPKKRKRKH